MYRLESVNNTGACNNGQVLIVKCSLCSALYGLDCIFNSYPDLSYNFSICLEAVLVAR